LPLTDWTVIGFAMPIFATILAAALLGEPVGRWRGSAVVIGFLGVLIAIGPKLNLAHGVPALIMLASTLCSGLVIVIIRKISASENGSAIAFYFMLACTVVSACTLPFAWVTPSMGDLLLLVAAGVCGGLGQVCNTFSYARGQPSMLGPFDYLGLIWAAGFDVALFSVWPDLTIWLGAAIIVASGLVIAWREHYRGQQKARIQSV
jgi:drug/metabolite transporter (DMT)-like permease